jgi:hypothetical protein
MLDLDVTLVGGPCIIANRQVRKIFIVREITVNTEVRSTEAATVLIG